jgi:hypothetical protein
LLFSSAFAVSSVVFFLAQVVLGESPSRILRGLLHTR